MVLGVSRDIAGGLFGGARREKPNDSGEANHHDDDRADEAGSWQEGGEEDGEGDRADDDEGDCAHDAGWFPKPVGRKRPRGQPRPGLRLADLIRNGSPRLLRRASVERGVWGCSLSQGASPACSTAKSFREPS